MQVTVYPPDSQGTGYFDGGKITEQKPIGFPGERSAVPRVGPLFYWAWAFAKEEGSIPLHPHHAFEIMTYVIEGRAEHGDTLGTRSTVGPGGAQVMQTGSGVSHEERFVGPDMEGCQIWFEPFFKQASLQTPTYRQHEDAEFPAIEGDGYRLKTVIGAGSPVELTVDARMWDLAVEAGREYRHSVPKGRSVAVLAVRGGGVFAGMGGSTPFQHKDFIVLHAEQDTETTIRADGENELRLLLIEVPTSVSYALYPKR